MLKRLIHSPWFFFLPFLFFYAYIIVINKWPTLYGDEIRYVDFAWALLHGYYSPPAPYINLWNGPGYPLTIAPFMALHLHALAITLMNALYLYISVVFLYKAIKLVADKKIALFFSLLLAVYPNNLSILPILYTEAFAGFLVSSLIYAVTLFYTKGAVKYSILAGVILGFLTLTKVIFGYVLIVGLITCLAILLFKKRKVYYLQSVKILLIAFAVTLPWLAYTYHMTGKLFYWGNSGGMSLYWMSTPYDNEYGDWKLPELTNNQYPIHKTKDAIAALRKNHAKEIGFILKHSAIEQDALFKQAAISNIKNNPLKFARNYYDNISRMLFNFPYSYAYQDGAVVGNIIRGSLILWASIAGFVLTLLNWRRVIYPVKFLLLLISIYLGLSGALSAYPRQLDVILPALLFWMGFLAANTPKISLKFTKQETLEEIELTDLVEVGAAAREVENSAR